MKFKLSLSLTKSQEKVVNSSVAVVFIVGILVLVNALGSRYFGRLDLTRDKVFTLSKASKNLVGNLSDNLIAKAYFTTDLPSPYSEYRKYVEDTLSEYKQYSRGKFTYEFIDPIKSTEAQQEAASYGIQPLSLDVVAADEYSRKAVYLGIVFLFEDKTESLPAITSTDGLEYDISSSIKKITRTETLTVGFLQDTDTTLTAYQDMSTAYSEIGQLYDSTSVTADAIPEDLSVLIVGGVTGTLSDYALYQIDQALMRGTKVLFLVDNVDVNLQGFTTQALNNGLLPLLSSYGVTVDANLVGDLQAKQISVSTRQGYFTVSNIVEYPFIPYIVKFDDNLISSRLHAVSLPFVSSLTLDDGKLQGNEVITILKSSIQSWSQTDFYNLNPLQDYSSTYSAAQTKGPFTLAVAIKGGFSSYFDGKAIPADPAAEAGADTALETKTTRQNAVEENRIIVIGTSKFIQDNFLLDEENLDLFINCIDWLTQNDELIGIRSKGVVAAPLKEMSDSSKSLVKWGTILGMPIFVVVVAMVRFRQRRRKTEQVYR